MNDHENMQSESVPDLQQTGSKEELKSGEKLFTYVLFSIGLFFLWQSIMLWLRMSPPRSASAAAVPLFTSGLWTLLSLMVIIENTRKNSPLTMAKSITKKLKLCVSYVLPKEVFVIICAILVYCILLICKANFYVVSSLFLYGSMCYLTGKNLVKNIIWTAIFMGFVFAVFRVMFGVVF